MFISLASVFLVTQLLPALACGSQKPIVTDPKELEAIKFCNEWADKKGISRDEVVPRKNSKDKWDCAICVGVVYTDPKCGSKKCCDLGEAFSTDPKYEEEGACCEEGLSYSFDPSVSKGSCCPKGQTFVENECKPAVIRESCPNDCNKGYTCACDNHLGIKYGHCYTMTDVNGLPLNRETSGVYQSGGDIGNLIFRVCKNTDDCTDSKGDFVPEEGSWYLEDQLSSRDTPGPGWFGALDPHMGIVQKTQTTLAAELIAEPFCFFGDCSLCLHMSEGFYRGLSAPCPLGAMSEKAHIGRAANPNNCKAYRFQEIKCLNKVNP